MDEENKEQEPIQESPETIGIESEGVNEPSAPEEGIARIEGVEGAEPAEA